MKNIEGYRKKQKTQAVLLFIAAFVSFAVYIVLMKVKPPVAGEYVGPAGGFAGVGTVLLVYAIQKVRALKSEKKLEEMRAKQTDERLRVIEEKAVYATYMVTMIALFLALVITSFINNAVFYTLLSVVAFIVITQSVFNIIYNKKY